MRPGSAQTRWIRHSRPGAYFVDTDGDGASSVGGTFVIEDSGWTSLPAGARKEFGEDFVSLLVVQVDEVWSPACGGDEPAGCRVDGGGPGQPSRRRWIHNPGGVGTGHCLWPRRAPPGDRDHRVRRRPESRMARTHIRALLPGTWSGRGLLVPRCGGDPGHDRSEPRSPAPRRRTWPSSGRCSTPW